MPSPLPQFGVVNRLITSLTWETASELNVTAAFLARGMIRFAREGEATDYLPVAAGAVPSVNAFLMVSLTMELIKTQPLAARYEARLLTNSILGKGTVRPDVSEGIGAFDLFEMSIARPDELAFDGSSAAYPITLRGYIPINSNLWP